MPHIMQVKVNTSSGSDYVVGDVHGSIDEFETLLKELKPKDRLFMVGDLVDKGKDSKRVLERIMEINRGKKPPIIYAVRGNHEDMFLKAYDALQSLENASDSQKMDIFMYLQNSGSWIFSNEETKSAATNLLEECKNLHSNSAQFRTLLDEFLARKDLQLIEGIKPIYGYIKSLPYVICVGTPKERDAFVVGHADVHLDDKELRKFIKNKTELPQKEIDHIIWARASERAVVKNPRNQDSLPVFCGHNILDTSENFAVRPETRHHNLDDGAFFKGRLLFVNYTKRAALYARKEGISSAEHATGDINSMGLVQLHNQFIKDSIIETLKVYQASRRYKDSSTDSFKIRLAGIRNSALTKKKLNQVESLITAIQNAKTETEIETLLEDTKEWHDKIDPEATHLFTTRDFAVCLERCSSLNNQWVSGLNFFDDVVSPSKISKTSSVTHVMPN